MTNTFSEPLIGVCVTVNAAFEPSAVPPAISRRKMAAEREVTLPEVFKPFLNTRPFCVAVRPDVPSLDL